LNGVVSPKGILTLGGIYVKMSKWLEAVSAVMPRRRIVGLLGGAMVALTLLGAAPAMAAGANGSAVPSSSHVSPFTVVNVGGGTWSYGSGLSNPWTQHVWSHYVHPTLYHSATAICGSDNPKVYANAGTWANADAYCAPWDSNAVYWNTY
jgi:hypothetical protein